ncbi:short-chain dehydrogenase [Seiridium cupressi]
MSLPLAGKLAIVTGASRGIGRAIATKLGSYGADLALAYTSPSSKSLAETLSKELKYQHKIKAFTVAADLGTPEGPKQLITATREHFSNGGGNFQIDILINNAGVAHNNPLPKVTLKDFDSSYKVNVLGPLLLTQAAEPFLPRDRSGRIVNLSSVSSSTGFIEQSVYGGTKAALEAMTRTWARELSERATVNAVNPGPVLGEMYFKNSDEFKREIKGWIEHSPLTKVRKGIDSDELVEAAKTSGGRPGYVDEIAGIVAMLCGKDAAWCTGQVNEYRNHTVYL